jgi:phosphopantothenoylcysteine decarboxylase/phosphopantothenate--cysteine ligase
MFSFVNKQILVGLTGSVAAYKSADLVRRLRAEGASVRVVMTRSAREFITPLTMQAVSGQPVHESLLDPQAEAAMGHIELARWADAILVAPASADFLARLSIGRADDLLSAICLATNAPVAVAPAMNRLMWSNPATRHNLDVLLQRGIHCFGPGEGDQACGETGPGRMLEPGELVEALAEIFDTGSMQGLSVLVSAGPTREPIDPVRYISNRSSGKMGFAIAAAAVEAGARVSLVSGPVHLNTPSRVTRVDVETAQQMYQAILDRASGHDVFISTAAVADYRPGLQAVHKLKKQPEGLQLALVRTPDILTAVANLPGRPFIVGFAAETERLEEHALAKLQNKKLDMIAANQVGPNLGFDVEENALEIMWEGGRASLEMQRKDRLARALIEIITERLHAKNSTENTG